MIAEVTAKGRGTGEWIELSSVPETFLRVLLLSEDKISADANASLFNSAGLVRSICKKVIRAIRNVSDAAEAQHVSTFEVGFDTTRL